VSLVFQIIIFSELHLRTRVAVHPSPDALHGTTANVTVISTAANFCQLLWSRNSQPSTPSRAYPPALWAYTHQKWEEFGVQVSGPYSTCRKQCSRWAGQVIGWASLSGARIRRGLGVLKTCQVWVRLSYTHRHPLGTYKHL
jgi:hypothetical protein